MPTTEKSRETSSAAIDRPFATALLKRAREAAKQYSVILWQEDGQYFGTTVELPHCLGTGSTPDHCIRQTRELMASAIATDLERGIEPPPRASANRRTEQVNIRVSPLERKRLEIAAEAGGYNGVSDYIRSVILAAR